MRRKRRSWSLPCPPPPRSSSLTKALNLLGASPRDLIAILQAMKAAGALDADLEVL
jgi:flagellar P-ring protein precursor FlgI